MLANVHGLRHDVVDSLKEMDITTVDHLLTHDSSELAPLCCIAEVELEKARAVVASKVGPRRQLADKPKGWISTKVPALDELLEFGLKRGSLTEFCGYGSTFLSKLVAREIGNSKSITIIVGGGNGRPDYAESQFIVEDITKLPSCVDAVCADSVSLNTMEFEAPVLVIVDTISRIMTATLACASAVRLKARALVEEIASSLRTLAVEANCAILLIAPCGSDLMERLWEQHIDVRVELMPTCDTPESDMPHMENTSGSSVQRHIHDYVLARTWRKCGGPMPEKLLDLNELRSRYGSS